MAMFAWMDLFIGALMNSDKSLKINNLHKNLSDKNRSSFFMLILNPFLFAPNIFIKKDTNFFGFFKYFIYLCIIKHNKYEY